MDTTMDTTTEMLADVATTMDTTTATIMDTIMGMLADVATIMTMRKNRMPPDPTLIL
jgi:hypothetical protein